MNTQLAEAHLNNDVHVNESFVLNALMHSLPRNNLTDNCVFTEIMAENKQMSATDFNPISHTFSSAQ